MRSLPQSPVVRGTRRSLLVALFATLAGGCGESTAPDPLPQAALASLAAEGPPYITGIVEERGARLGSEASILVTGRSPARGTEHRAFVSLPADVTVLWHDGRRASTDELRPGRRVSAWVGPVELRSMPPVVFGRIILIER